VIRFFLGGRGAVLPLLLFLLAGRAFLPAHTAAELEALLAADAVTYSQAARFVLDAASAAVTSDPAEAFGFAMARGWLPRGAMPDDPARLDGVSLLFMRAFGLGGGMMFTLTGAAHFAYREMAHLGLLQGRRCPRQAVSGAALVYVTDRVLARVEGSAGGRQ